MRPNRLPMIFAALCARLAASPARADNNQLAQKNAIALVRSALSTTAGDRQPMGSGATFTHYAMGMQYKGPVDSVRHMVRGLVRGLSVQGDNHPRPTHEADWAIVKYNKRKRAKYGETHAKSEEQIYRGYTQHQVKYVPGPTGKHMRDPRVEVVANAPKGSRIRVHGPDGEKRVTVTKQDRRMGSKVRITVVEPPQATDTFTGDKRSQLYKARRMSATFHRRPIPLRRARRAR